MAGGEPQVGVRIDTLPAATPAVSATVPFLLSGLMGSYALTNNMTDT